MLRKRVLATLMIGALLSMVAPGAYGWQRRANGMPALLWKNPGDISKRNLFYGAGAAKLAPVAPFKFLKEDKDGESPKIKVRDARGVEWSVKLGPEAQAETVATRLVWAVGYFAEEAYYLRRATIEGLPSLSRGEEYVVDGRMLVGARFEPRREGVKRGGAWDWSDNPFAGTRELSGLKVLMIMLNNYDARTDNNRVFTVRDKVTGRLQARYVVSDLGATLGKAGGFGGKRSKNDLEDFLSTKFVVEVEDGVVEFDYNTRPTKFGALSVLYPPYYRGEVKKEKDMRGIPVAHARWIGRLLARLSDEQLRDAFRAAGYDGDTMEGYVRALRRRIAELTRI